MKLALHAHFLAWTFMLGSGVNACMYSGSCASSMIMWWYRGQAELQVVCMRRQADNNIDNETMQREGDFTMKP